MIRRKKFYDLISLAKQECPCWILDPIRGEFCFITNEMCSEFDAKGFTANVESGQCLVILGLRCKIFERVLTAMSKSDNSDGEIWKTYNRNRYLAIRPKQEGKP